MRLIDKYEFTNGALFETYLLERQDVARYNVPECDVIGLRRVNGEDDRMVVLRPDEALIQARMLIDAVNKVTSGYEIELKSPVRRSIDGRAYPSQPLAMELVDDLQEVDRATPKGEKERVKEIEA